MAPSAYQLLGGSIDDPVRPSEVHVPLEMVADLYAYPLIITSEYVGADRRIPVVPAHGDRGGRRPVVRAAQALAIVLVTLAVAVPLTLMASHAAVAGTSGRLPLSSRPPASSPGRLTASSPDRTLAIPRPSAGRPHLGSSSRAERVAASALVAQQRSARRTAARAASAARQRLARAARVRHQEAQRSARQAARARHLALAKQARARRRH